MIAARGAPAMEAVPGPDRAAQTSGGSTTVLAGAG